MTPITFTAYSGFGSKVVVIAERITHFYRVDYNGNSGTCIVLDTGKEVTVSESDYVVREAVEKAQSPPLLCQSCGKTMAEHDRMAHCPPK